MPWTRLDDQFIFHEKARLAGKEGRNLQVTALCYCASQLNDGFIREGLLPTIFALADCEDGPATVAVLVEVGMWETREGGYQIHDYLDYNPSREKVLAERADNAKRQAEWQAAHRDKAGRYNAVSNAVSKQEITSAPSPSPVPVPVPVPEPKETITATISLHSAKPVQPNGKETPLVAVATKAVAKPQSKPLQPYEIQFLEIFEFRSGRYPTKAMRKIVQEFAEKYGETEFVAAANIAAGKNIRKLPYVEGILKRSKANNNRAGPGPPRGDMQRDFDMIDEVTAMIERGESYFGH